MSQTALKLDCQYLTFNVGQECFAIDIGRVREVLEYTNTTVLPRMPDYMRGVVNIRGKALPVIDLGMRLGMGMTEKTVNTCVIITEIATAGTTVTVGALVDAVEEVFDLDSSEIEAAPNIGNAIDTSFIKGIGKNAGRFVILLDLEKMFSEQEVAGLSGTTADISDDM